MAGGLRSTVAERTQALSFADGVLRVAVPDEVASELQGLAPRYLAAINESRSRRSAG